MSTRFRTAWRTSGRRLAGCGVPLALALVLGAPVLAQHAPVVLGQPVVLGAVAQRPDGELHRAIAENDARRVEELLAQKVDVEFREEHGRTPLYTAAREGRSQLALALLAAGAQPNSRNYAGVAPLHAAAAGNHGDTVRVLLANCADIDARDLQERTPLFLAAARGHEAVVRLLLANGADAGARRRGGSTPLTAATSFRQSAAAALLRERVLAQLPPLADAAEGSATLPPVAAAPPLPALARPQGPEERRRFVEEKLREFGYDPGPVDARPSGRARTAIQAFQREIGQVPSGTLSPCLIERIAQETRLRAATAARSGGAEPSAGQQPAPAGTQPTP